MLGQRCGPAGMSWCPSISRTEFEVSPLERPDVEAPIFQNG